VWQVAGKAPSYSAIIPSKQGVAAGGRQDALVVKVRVYEPRTRWSWTGDPAMGGGAVVMVDDRL
jgi:hypothetical protein